MIIDLATTILLVALPAIVGIIAQVDKGHRGAAWALAALLVQVLLIELVSAGLPFAMANSHGDGTLVLAALCGFIVMLGLVATLPHQPRT